MSRPSARGSVSGVEVHGAGAQAPALPEITASPSLESIITGFVQVIQRSSSLHVGAAGLWRSVALQFLHQQLAAATQHVPELPQRAAALEGAAAVLQTHTTISPSVPHPRCEDITDNLTCEDGDVCFASIVMWPVL